MYNRKLKKIIFFFFLIVCALYFISCISQPSKDISEKKQQTAEKSGEGLLYQSEELEVSMTYGFQGRIQKNRKLPIQLKFKTETDWKGSIKVFVPSSSKKETSYGEEVILKKGVQEFDLSIPNIGMASYFKICLEDSIGKEVFMTRIETEIDAQNLSYMGVLSENSEQVLYFDHQKKQRGNREATIKQIIIEEKSLSEEIKNLSVLDYLLINNFSIDTLSEEQRRMILDWVEQGGVLLTGMGGSHMEEFSDLLESVVDLEEPKKEKVLAQFYSEQGEENVVLDHIQVRVKEGYDYQTLLDRDLIKAISYGKGNICIAEFDLGEELLKPYQSSIARLIINQVTTERFFSLTDSREEMMLSLEQALYMYYGDGLPNVFLYILLFFVYIVLIGPTSYFILRHFDCKSYFFTIVLILSFIFTGFILMASRDDRRGKPVVTSLHMIESGEDEETVYVSSENTKEREYKLELVPPFLSIEVMEDSDSLDQMGGFYSKIDKEIECALEKRGETMSIRFLEKPAFDQSVFRLSKKGKARGELEYEISITTDLIQGKVQNNTQYHFDYLLFYYQKRFFFVKGVEKGERVEIDNEELRLIDLTANMQEYFLESNQEDANLQKEERTKKEVQNIFAFLYQNILKDSLKDEGYFVGVTEDVENKVLKEKEFVWKQKMVYIQPVDGEKIKRKEGADISELYLTRIEGEMDDGILYSGNVVLEYQFANQMKKKGLIRSDDYYKGEIYAYHYKDKKFNRVLENSGDKLTEAELSDYINAEGRMRIRLKPKADYAQIPIIRVVESESDAKRR